MTWSDAEARERVARVEALLAGLDGQALDAVAGLVDVYGEALARVVDRVPATELAGDELIRHLLIVHGLHPQTVEERVCAALDEVRPYLASHSGGVELIAVEGDVVRLRLEGTCHGCPSSSATLKLAVEEAIFEAAPEIERVEAEGAVEEMTGVALPILQVTHEAPGPCPVAR
jgi:Fe-S cluster biogenesis protein NfuA